VLVVGNPANTNALIAHEQRRRRAARAVHRDDAPRSQPRVAQLAQKTGAAVSDDHHMAVWGNHSPTMYPDLFNAKVRGERAWDAVGDEAGSPTSTSPGRQARGGDHRGARRVVGGVGGQRGDRPRARLGARHGRRGVGVDAVRSDGSYGVAEGIISSFPVRTSGGAWEIVQGLEVPEFSQARIDKTVAELLEERDAVTKLGLV
jgi:malate dehydrogenase